MILTWFIAGDVFNSINKLKAAEIRACVVSLTAEIHILK